MRNETRLPLRDYSLSVGRVYGVPLIRPATGIVPLSARDATSIVSMWPPHAACRRAGIHAPGPMAPEKDGARKDVTIALLLVGP
jgi:hypothetical protein